MLYNKLFNELNKEFDQDISLMVIQCLTIHLSNDPTDEEWENSGSDMYKERLRKLISCTLWEEDHYKVGLAMNIWDVIPDWEIGQTFDTPKTFRELLGLLPKECN
jgi:hypothetical protein